MRKIHGLKVSLRQGCESLNFLRPPGWGRGARGGWTQVPDFSDAEVWTANGCLGELIST
jgi:hypothetical protein